MKRYVAVFGALCAGVVLWYTSSKPLEDGIEQARQRRVACSDVPCVVRKGDTLYGIAKKMREMNRPCFTSIARIRERNNLHSDTIHVGQTLVVPFLDNVVHVGYASWYGPGFYGKTTSNGELYRGNTFTAAHKTLPFGSLVRVTDNEGRSIVVRINDRGPYVEGRIIDVSRKAAARFGLIEPGIKQVTVEEIG